MQRRALLVALIGVGAALAFGVGADTLDDALGSADPVPDAGEELPTGSTGGGKSGGAGGAAGAGGGCCGFGGVSLAVAGLLPAVPLWATLGLGIAGLVVLATLWRRAGRGSEGALADRDRRGDGLDAASDRGGASRSDIEQPAADNAVYRAWGTLAERVGDRDRATTTPGEYAAAARERGLDDGAVRTVTDLFERVRYGDEPVTEDRAERATTAAETISGDDR